MTEKYDVFSLKKAHEEYTQSEGRHKFYDMAQKLMHGGYSTEARILLLYGWNGAWLTKLSSNFRLERFEETLEACKPYFDKLRGKNLLDIQLKEYEDEIKTIFGTLSSIEEIKYTGASKLMSLEIPNLFVMWDKAIRGSHVRDVQTPEGYYHFLELSQQKALDLVWIPEECDNVTLAKVIDEFNYVHPSNEKNNKSQKKNNYSKETGV